MTERLRGTSIERDLASYKHLVAAVKERARILGGFSDRQLRKQADSVRAEDRASTDNASPIEALALACEAARRTLELDPFDAQIFGAAAMWRGHIAEMQTGEGKTLAAALTASALVLNGRRIHILTCNDYLAARDAEWMGPLYGMLGIGVGSIAEHHKTAERQRAYSSDITYATAHESGFDFLRDSLCLAKSSQVHQPFDIALIDEADSILIDEGRLPLVIASVGEQGAADTGALADLAATLTPQVHFSIGEDQRNVHLSDFGIDAIETALGCGSLYDEANYDRLTQIELAVHAAVLLHRDVDYIVRDGAIVLVDENTGRTADRRHWPKGLQTALEAKEKLTPKREGRVLGQLTLQHFLQLYRGLCGMTATAQESADEFHAVYGLGVTVIPQTRPCVRTDETDRIFIDHAAHTNALVAEISRIHAGGQPILVGTSSVAESEALAQSLGEQQMKCRVLNAVTETEREARIIAEAGDLGAITVSTNMAGRGTDIRLGGADEANRERVVELGGLHVIGTNRHDSLRIDKQLRGRAGRQGDPGSSRFLISLQDPLLAKTGVAAVLSEREMARAEAFRDNPIDAPLFASRVDHAQRVIDGQNAEIRKTLIRYFNVAERQRQELDEWRQALIECTAPTLLAAVTPRTYGRAQRLCGDETTAEIEKRLTLRAIDSAWAEHLAFAADVREGVHLLSAIGKNPLDDFNKRIDAGFSTIRQRIRADVVGAFESIDFGDADAVRYAAELRGPSSTWTYIISDDPFVDGIESMLGRNVGFAAGAALSAGPLLLMIAGWRRIRRLITRRD